jgi:uncharacterized protein YkwD
MSRQAERRLLGVLGFVAVAIVMFAAVRLLANDPAEDIAAGEASRTAAVDDARDTEGDESDRDGGVGRAPLTVDTSTSTTGAMTSSPTSSTTPPTTATTEPVASSSTTSTGETTTTFEATSSSTTSSSTTTVMATTSSSTTTTAVITTSSSTTTPTTAPAGLTAVEREVIRLTNQLRSNPSGPLRRVAPMPGCVDDEFFAIQVDPGTGHPRSVPELVANEAVSIKLSRDWSIRMADADEMTHRSNESQSAIYSALGINRSRSSENVAWLSGYPESAIAMQLFVGWRESSTGHYCSLLAGSLTHIGVGHHRTDSGKDWATQNFYAQR